MRFHTFGNADNRAIILIHGVLTPWQMWDYLIERLKDDFYVIVPALDGHVEEESSQFVSVEKEAEQIEDYILENLGGEVYAVCGISMGGVICSIIWKNGRVKINRLVMDGAPLVKLPRFMVGMMTSNYLTILHGSKKRDPKTLRGFSKNLLPEKYLPQYLAITDLMDDSAVVNMVGSVFNDHYPHNADSTTDVLFIHGTKANEMYSAKAAARLKKDYPAMRVIRCNGMMHCENACFHPERWYADVIGFLNL